ALNAARSVPADDIGRNFVADATGHHRSMPVGEFGGAVDSLAGVLPRFLDLQEAQMFLPRDIDKYLQPVFVCRVQQPGWWNMVGANRVDMSGPHTPEIIPDAP